MLEIHVELFVWGGAGSEMASEKGMVAQGGRELQVISPWVGPTVVQVRTENIRLVWVLCGAKPLMQAEVFAQSIPQCRQRM